MSATVDAFLDPVPRPLAPSEQRAELERLGAALRLVTAQATEDARRVEAPECGEGCEECAPRDEDHKEMTL